MGTNLNLLIVEDSADDASLLVAELRTAGFDVVWTRVETEIGFLTELKNSPDIILSDYRMPQFSGLRAIELLNQSGLEFPLLLISGTVGEDAAVEAMKLGAADYLLKDRLGRLGSAVRQALEQKRLRDERRLAGQQIRMQASALEASANAILITDAKGSIVSANTAACALTGYTADEMVGRNPRFLKSGRQDSQFYKDLWETILSGLVWRGEMSNRRKDGTIYEEEMTITPVRADDNRITHFIAVKQDITERKRAEQVVRDLTGKEAGRGKTRMIRELAIVFAVSALVWSVLLCTNVLQAPSDMVLKYANLFDEVIVTLLVMILGLTVVACRRWKETQSHTHHRRLVEQALKRLHDELEKRVQQRTLDLVKVNNALRVEVAERRRAEEGLNLFRILVDRSNDMIEVIDPETGRILDINETTCLRLGYRREELLTMTVADVDPIVVTPANWPEIAGGIREAGFKNIEGWHRRKDGSVFPIEVSARCVMLDREYMIAAVRDITERKRADEALRESEEKFRQLAENINEVFWISEPAKNRILYISPAFEKIWGRTCTSLYQSPQTWLEAIHPEDRGRIFAAARTKQALGTYDETYRITRPDGSLRWISDKAFPVRNAAGEIYRVVGTAEDITAQRLLEDQFRQSQKMEAIGQLASGVAHDFNNILAIIQMQIGLLGTGENLSAEQLESFNDIGVAVGRAAALTRQLLLFSRRQAMEQCELNLGESITNMTRMLHRLLGEDIQIQFKLSPQSLYIHADAGMMDQVLMNLAVNSRDAMPGGGQLIIETSAADFDETFASKSAQTRPGSFACLSVTDTGCGMPPETLSRIFEPFFTTKEVGKGTGLGLATVFGIVQQHQGWINVYSEIGRGTTFRIYLPRLGKSAEQGLVSAGLSKMRGGSETILLVEDDAALRVSQRRALLQLGYRVLEAANGAEALEIWRLHREQISLLLTDMVMPGGMTGKILAERLLLDRPALKVIYASGYSAEIAYRNFPLEEGVNFLAKPFEAQKLAQTIRAALDTKTA